MIGTDEAAEVGVELALAMAGAVLETVRAHPGRPILFLLDTQGQRLRRRDELLGLNGYMAHLAKCVETARSRGHRILSLVYGQAVSGGYLTTGMMADACYALADAEIKVMNLPAMSRITKIPLERLEALAQQSPVFSPGVRQLSPHGSPCRDLARRPCGTPARRACRRIVAIPGHAHGARSGARREDPRTTCRRAGAKRWLGRFLFRRTISRGTISRGSHQTQPRRRGRSVLQCTSAERAERSAR